MATANRPSTSNINPYDSDLQQCPVPTYHALRESEPVYYSQSANLFIVTRLDLIEEVLKDPVTFSNNCPREDPPNAAVQHEIADIQAAGWPHVPTLADQDPPLHRQFRAVVTPFFSPSAIRAYESRAREVSDTLLDQLGDREVDFVSEFAEPLPIQVTAELMNLEPDMDEAYRGWTKSATLSIGNRASDAQRVAAQRQLVEMQKYFFERLERARRHPGTGFFNALIDARIADAGNQRPLSTDEMISLCRQLFVGGIETTTKLLAEAVRMLAEDADKYQALRSDPSGLPRFIEETLRLSSPAQGIPRRAVKDTELGGVSIPAGSTLIVMYAAANRDPDLFPAPDDLDTDRANLRRHLAFGKGIHFCLGAPISRMEALIALQGLLARFPRLELLSRRNDFAYEPSFILRGLTSLWVTLHSSDTTDRNPLDD